MKKHSSDYFQCLIKPNLEKHSKPCHCLALTSDKMLEHLREDHDVSAGQSIEQVVEKGQARLPEDLTFAVCYLCNPPRY